MPLSFTSSGDYPIGDDPVDLAVADLNGDGTPDIVTVNRHDGTLTFLRGNGDGTFSEVGGFPIGSFPAAIEVADLNGDGAADLVVADKDNGTVDVVLGDGNGGFLPQTNLATADTLPLSVAVGDLNGDGKLDLVSGSAMAQDGSVSVFLGNGNGTFQGQVPYSVPGASNAVALADLNGDGKADLVAVSTAATSVLLGNGDGTFQTPYVAGYGGYSVAIADLNADGKLDLVKTQGGSVLVQLGNGDGTFSAQTSYADGPGAFRVAIADLDGDGRPDLAVSGDTSVQVLLGNGDGTFQSAQKFSVDLPHALAIADLNNDGKPDIATVNATDTVSILFNTSNVRPTIRLFDDTGASATDHITASPILTGTAAPGTVVTLMEGTTILGTGTADASGTWGFLFPTLPSEGSHTVTANTAGGSSSPLTFTLDRSLVTPTIGLAHDTGTSASDNITSDATLTGTTDPGAAVAVYDLTGFITSGGSSPPVLLETVTADASGTWTYTPSVPDGPHAFMAHATDLAGNVRDSSPFYMTLDTSLPTIRLFEDTGASASDHITADPILTGTAAPGTAVTLMEGTTVLGTETADATGTWGFFFPTIQEGSHTVTANTAGGSSSLTFTLDNSLATPTIRLANDTGASASDNISSDATLTGTTDAGAAVGVYDLTGYVSSGGSSPPVLLAAVTADASGTWSYTPSLPDGPHAFMAHATDLAGNVRDSSPFYMTLDTSAPTIRLFDDTGASAIDHITANPILTGTAAPGTAVTLMEGTTVLGTGTADGSGTWGFLFPALPSEGQHTVTANTAGGSSSLTFTLDRSLVTPSIGLAHDTGTSASDNITSDATLTGTTDAGAAVAVYDLTGLITSGGSSPPVLLATVTADASGTWTYTPSVPDGPHAFMVEATDVAGNVRDSSPFYMTLDTAPPVAHDDSYTLAEDTTLTVAAPALLANDSDANGDILSAALVSGPAHGSLALNANGALTYTPAANFNGTDSFTYKANDGQADSNVATVFLTVTPVNDAPVAHDDSYTLAEDTTLTLAAPAILANDSDADGDALSATLVSGPRYGSLALNANGALTYTPFADFWGTDSFTYKVNDDQADSNVANVFLRVTPVNDAPVAHDDSYTLAHDTPLTIKAAGVLANDSDLEGDPLSAILVGGPAHGNVSLTADGAFTYTPAANFSGTDSFTYKANDGQADSNVATVNLAITSANHAPVTNDDIAGVAKGQTITANVQHGVLANDTDPDGNSLSVSAVNGSAANVGHAVVGTYGSLTINGDGSYSYVASKLSLPSQAVAHDSFDYTASDGHGGTSTAALTVTITNPGMVYRAGTDGNDTLIAGSSQSVLDGGNGNDILKGSGTADVLIGGRGADIMTGGNGPDTFLFGPNFGNDVITDFKPHNDVIQFDHSLFASFADLHAADDGHGNTVITHDASDTVTLQGVALANLHASDFLFV